MPKVEKEVKISNPQGLHARPAALFVQIASKFDSEVIVKKDGQSVNGKSIMGILMLAAECDSTVTMEVQGHDAQRAAEELEGFLTKHE